MLGPSHILHMPFTEPLSVKLSFSSASFTHRGWPCQNTDMGVHPKPPSSSQSPISPKNHHDTNARTVYALQDSFSNHTHFSSIMLNPHLYNMEGPTSAGASHRQDQAVHSPFTLTMCAAMVVRRERSERARRHSGAVAQTPALSCSSSPSHLWWFPVWHSPGNTNLH